MRNELPCLGGLRLCSMIAVLFDLEGTLVQSVVNDLEVVLEFRDRIRKKLLELGIPSAELDVEVKSTLVRNRALRYVQEHFTEREANIFSLEMDRFLKSYELSWTDRSRIFPDTITALQELKQLGYRMGIVTNTSREAADRMLSVNNMRDFFEVIITREDAKMLKPEPEGTRLALKRLKAQRFVFVGDQIHDVHAAEKAGGISIIVNREPSKRLDIQADYVVESLTETPRLVQQIADK